jgi:phosphoglycerate kinase
VTGSHPRPSIMSGLPLLEDLPDVRGARVLVRVDFNTPLSDDGHGRRLVADEFRIRAALPTLRWLAEQGAEITCASHLGRPKGAPDPRFDMSPVRECLAALAPGVTLLDNLRFTPREAANDPGLVSELVAGQDAYVNEAFGVSHRAHASIVGPPALLPSAAGRKLAREVEVLGDLLESPARPFVAVVGGAKIADKLGVLRSLATKVDVLAVGGAMAFTFLLAAGHEVGGSMVDESQVAEARALLESGATILLPTDVVALTPDGALVTSGPQDEAGGKTTLVGEDVPDGWRGCDVGPDTAAAFAAAVTTAATVLWNGPLGVVEDDRFAEGTRRVAEAVAGAPGFTVVGGGDSVSALDHLGLADRVDFLSTGGGASLELLEKGDLPGLVALRGASNAPGKASPAAR